MTPAAPPVRRIVYDIDGVLCTCNADSVEEVAFFAQHGLIITAIKTHYVFPGAVELIKASFDEPDTEIYFFSRGIRERNTEFVYKLLEVIFGKQRAMAFPVEERVFTVRRKIYVGDPDENKDLRLISDDIQNCVLVEDSRGMICPGQFKNLLYVYEPRYQFSPFCDSDGYIPIEPSMYMPRIEGRLQIGYKQKQCALKVTYLEKKTRKTASMTLSVSEHPEIVREPNLHKSRVCQIVAEAGGVAKEIDRSANHLFYYAGMLFISLAEQKETGAPLCEILYRRQWTEKSPKELAFTSLFDETYYEYGLSVLRKYNPSLGFMTPMKYKEARSIMLGPETKALYETYLKNKAD